VQSTVSLSLSLFRRNIFTYCDRSYLIITIIIIIIVIIIIEYSHRWNKYRTSRYVMCVWWWCLD